MAAHILQNNENYKLELIDYNGHLAVKKTVQSTALENRKERLQNDIAGMQYFAKLNINLYVPTIYKKGENYYIREYFAKQFIEDNPKDTQENRKKLAKLAKVLADIDRIEPFGATGFVGSSNYRQIDIHLDGWGEEAVKHNQITAKQLQKAKSIIIANLSILTPRIAHGDMGLKHIYLAKNGRLAFVDFELYTTQAARYYDVAWCYMRLYQYNPILANCFLSSFLKNADKPSNWQSQLYIIFLQRAVGLQKDVLKLSSRCHKNAADILKKLLKNDKLEAWSQK